MRQPVSQRRHTGQFFRMQQAFHGTTMTVATDDNILNAKRLNRELDGGRFSSIGGTVGRNGISCISQSPGSVLVIKFGSSVNRE